MGQQTQTCKPNCICHSFVKKNFIRIQPHYGLCLVYGYSASKPEILTSRPFKKKKKIRRPLTGGSDGKQSACNAGDLGSIPGSGRSPGEGNGNPLQYSCLGKIPWTEETGELGGLPSTGLQKSDTTKRLTLSLSLTQRLPYVPPLLISPRENHSFDICYCRLGFPVLNFTCMEYCSFYSLSMTVRLIRVLRPFHSSITTNVTVTFQASSALSHTAGWLLSLAEGVPVTGSTGPPAALRALSLQRRFFCLSVCHCLHLPLIYF